MSDKELIERLNDIARGYDFRSDYKSSQIMNMAAKRIAELTEKPPFDPVMWLRRYSKLQAESHDKIDRLVRDFYEVVLNKAADAMEDEIARTQK